MDNKPVKTPLQIAAENAATKLLKCLAEKSSRVQDKYDYYNADNDVRDFGISVPMKMVNSRPGIGWASRCVNTLADRVVFEGFAGDTFSINDDFSTIQATHIINKAKHDAFIAGCAFVAVAADPNGTDRTVLIPFTALEATGIVDQTTGLLSMGLAVTSWEIVSGDSKKRLSRVYGPKNYIVFTPEFTAVFENRTLYDIYPNPTGRCLLHPLTHKSSADRPLGKSRITNTARRIIQEVGRVKRRYEIAGEFYSTPQRYINGLAEGAEKDASLDSTIGKVWAINKDEDGEKPEIGVLTQMSISQFSDAKKDLARDFCAETALTLRNLGYETGNPSSPESLAAMSDDLLLEAQTSQTEMGEQIKQIAITYRMAVDGSDTTPDQLKTLVPAWKPIFQIDLGAAGDAMFKLFEIMPELQGSTQGYRLLGLSMRDAEELAAKRAAMASKSFMGGGPGTGGQ